MHGRMAAAWMLGSLSIAAIAGGLTGCKSEVAVEPAYDTPLGPGECALKRVAPDAWPDLGEAWRNRTRDLSAACDQSIRWFGAPSSARSFPYFDVSTSEQAGASVVAFKDIAFNSQTEAEFEGAMHQMFDCWQTVGYNRKGVVLFTGYYAPEFRASKTQRGSFKYPLYRRPADLVTDPITGEPRGRQMADGSIKPWPGRAELDRSQAFAGTELVWLPSALDAYIIQVNGSAKLLMDDGTVSYIGYAGKTDGEYVGLGESLVKEGVIKETELGLPAIRSLYEKDPERIIDLINRNNCYVFFTDYDGKNWPAGSLGVKVSNRASLATDKKVYPPGGIVLVDTSAITLSSRAQRFNQFMLDQDTGGAIRAPGRADIFMGVGSDAEILAGGQYAEGTMYYFFLKPDYMSQYPLPKKQDKGKEGTARKPAA